MSVSTTPRDGALGTVREDAKEERAPVPVAQLALHALPVASTRLRSAVSSGWSTAYVNVSIGRPTSCKSRLKLSRDLRREFPDLELPVEEDGADVRARQEVVHVVGELGEIGDLPLVLRVHRVELLVDALELLVRALQLLVGGEELFVRRLQLFVARLELLGRRLQGSASCNRAPPRARRAARATRRPGRSPSPASPPGAAPRRSRRSRRT